VDDLDADLMAAHDDAVVDGLASLLQACAVLHEHRVAQGLGLEDLADRCDCETTPLEWVDGGDVAAPAEALVYYAAALGFRVRFAVERATPAGTP
jgi:hypothetical protein